MVKLIVQLNNTVAKIIYKNENRPHCDCNIIEAFKKQLFPLGMIHLQILFIFTFSKLFIANIDFV